MMNLCRSADGERLAWRQARPDSGPAEVGCNCRPHAVPVRRRGRPTAGLRTRLPRRRPGRCPFGVCAEPSNVKAGGTACPYRFRCAGCDHFRTDISYLPDLQAYLDDLLRSRERILAATTDIDEWVKSEAMPSAQEITRIRRLISRITGDLDRRAKPPNPAAVCWG